MVMIGDVEIEVKLNYDNIDKALVELQEKLNKLNLQVPASVASGKNSFEGEPTMGDGRSPSGAPGIGIGRKGYEYRASQVPVASGVNGICCGVVETKKTNALLSKQGTTFAKGLEQVGDSTKAGLISVADSKFADVIGTALALTDTGLNAINLGIALADKVDNKKNDRIWNIDRNLHNLRWNVNRTIPQASWDIVSAIERNSGSDMLDMIKSAISDSGEGGGPKIIDKKGTAKAFETVATNASKRVTRTLKRFEPVFDVFGQGDAYRRATSTVSSFIEQSGKTLSSPYMDPHFKEVNEKLGNVGQALASVAMGGSASFDQSIIDQSKLTAKALDILKNKLNKTITEGKKQFSSEEKRTQIEEKITELENGIEEITKGLESGNVDLDLKSISEEYEKKIDVFLEEIEGEIGLAPIRKETTKLYEGLAILRKKISARGIGLYDSIASVATTVSKTGDAFQSTISKTRKDSLKNEKTLDRIKNSDVESFPTNGGKIAVLGMTGFGALHGVPKEEQSYVAQEMLGNPLKEAINDENINVHVIVPEKTDRSEIGIIPLDYARVSLETDQANYSQDALDVVAGIYKTFKNNKELDTFNVVGHSLGGGVAREVMEIIHELNLTKLLEAELGRKITIRAITLGTAVAGQANPDENRPEGQERDFFPLMNSADPVAAAQMLLDAKNDIVVPGGIHPEATSFPGHDANSYALLQNTQSAIGNFIRDGVIPEPEIDQQRPDLKETLLTPIASEVARSRELGGVDYIGDVAKRLNEALTKAGVYDNIETVAKGSVLASLLIARGVKEEIAVPIDEKAIKIQYQPLIEETAQKIFSGEISEDMGTLPELAFLKTNADRQKDWKPISDYLVNNAPEQILPEIMVLFGDLFDQQSEVVKKEIQRQVDVLRKTSANKIKNKEVATQKEQEREAKDNPQPSEEVLNLVKDIPWDVPPPPKKLNAWDLLEKESTDTLRQVAERVNVSPYKDVEEKGIARLKIKTGPDLLSDIKKAMASSKEPAKDIQRILNSMSLAEKEKNIASDIIGLKKSDLQALSASLGLPITRLFKDKEGKESKQSLNNAELAQQIIDNIQPIGKRKNIGGRERITKDPQFTYPEVEETMKRMEIGESTKSTADKLAKATVGELRIIAKALGIAVKKTVSDPENSEKISEVYLKQKELIEAISVKSDEEIEKARNTRRGEIGQEAETRGLSLKNVARQLNIKTEEEYSTKSGTPRIRRRKTGDVLNDISRKPKEEVIEAKRKAESFDVLPSSLEEKIMEDIDKKEKVIKQKLKELTENPKLFREKKKGEEDITGALFAFLRAFKGKNPTGSDDPVESENEKFFSSIENLQKENNTSRPFQERVLKFEEEMQKQLHLMKSVIDKEFGPGTYEEAVLASAEQWSSKELKGFVNIIQDEFALKDDIEKEMIAKINSSPLTKKKKEKAIQQMKEDLERKLPKEEILANIQDTLRERGVVDRGEDPKGFKRIRKLGKAFKIEAIKGYSGKEIGTSPEMKNLVRKTDEENEGKPDRRKNLLKIEEFEEIGRLVREGIQKGLTDQEIRENIFTTLLNKWQSELEIKSPSRVMIRMGQMIIKGLEIGLQSFEKVKKYLIDSTKEVLKTMERLININPVKDFQARGVELTRTTPISKSETVSEEEIPENIREKPEDLFTKVSKNIYSVVDQVTEPIRNIGKTYDDISNGRNVSTSIVDVEKEGEKEGEKTGNAVRDGFVDGLLNQPIAETMMTDLLDKWKDIWGIQSPSKVMQAMGEMIIKGLEIGLQSFENVKKYLIDNTKELITTIQDLIKNNPFDFVWSQGNTSNKTANKKSGQGISGQKLIGAGVIPVSKTDVVSEEDVPENLKTKENTQESVDNNPVSKIINDVAEKINKTVKGIKDIIKEVDPSTRTVTVESEVVEKNETKTGYSKEDIDKGRKIMNIANESLPQAEQGINMWGGRLETLKSIKAEKDAKSQELKKQRIKANLGKYVEIDSNKKDEAKKIGKSIKDGIEIVLKKPIKESLMSDLLNKWRDIWGIHSPADESWDIGDMIIKGLELGLKGFDKVKKGIIDNTRDLVEKTKANVEKVTNSPVAEEIKERSGYNAGKQKVNETVESVKTPFNKAQKEAEELFGIYENVKTSVKEGVDVFNKAMAKSEEVFGVYESVKTSVKEGVDVFNKTKDSIQNAADVIDKVADAAEEGVKVFNEVVVEVKEGIDTFNKGKKKVKEGVEFVKKAKETVVGGVKVGAESIQSKVGEGKGSGILRDIINKIESEEVIQDAKEVIQDAIAFLRDPKEENRVKVQETLKKKGYLAQKGNPEMDKALLKNWAFRGGSIITATKWLMDHKEEVQKFVTESIDTASRFERFTRSIDYITGGAKEGADKLSDLRETAKESGIELEGLIDSYTQLAITTKNTSLEGLTTDKLVKGLSQLGTQQGLSAEELQGAQTAIGQMAGKGVISAEEMRGQLAERLPGALQIASRSMGMSDKDFMGLVATGKLSSAEFLPRFANQIEKETSARGGEDPLTALALLNKQKNAILEIQLATGNLFLPIYKSWIKVSTAVLEGLKNITAAFVNLYALQLLYFGQTANAFTVLVPGLLPFVKILGTILKHIFPVLKTAGSAVFSFLGKAMISGAKQGIIFKLALESILATIDSLILVANGLMDWFGNGILKAFGKDAFVIDNTIWKDWGDTVVANSKRVTKALEEVEGKQKRLSNIQTPNAENKVVRSGNMVYDNFGLRDNALPIAGGFLAGGGIATAGFMAAGGTTALAGAAAGAAAGGFGTGAAIGSMAGPIGILVGALIGAAIAATAANMLGGGLNNSIRKDIEKENKKREKKGLAEMTDEEINAYAEKEQRKHNSANMKKKDQAAIIRDIRVQSVHDTILDPAIKEIEKYKNGTGLFQQAEDSNKRLKALKEKESALDPNDKIGRDRLAEEIRKEEIYNRETTKPLDFMGESIRAALDSDRKRLKDYEQALIDQNLEGGATDQETKENKKKKERAEKFLRTPGNQFDDMEKVKVQIALLEKISNLFGLAEVESGAVSDLKKFTNALVELGTAFGSIEERMNAINRASLKGISLAQDKGFNNDRFNEPMTALRTAEEARKNTLRHLEEREKIVKRLEGDLEKGSGGEAKDRLIEAEEKNKGRKLTGEEIRAIATTQAAANPSSAVVQSLEAEAQLRDEKEKTLDLEKQAVDDIYNVKMAQQGLFLAQLEDFRAEGQAKNQRTLANATRRMNVGLKDGLKTDLGAEDKFNIGQGELQLKDIQNQIKLNEEAQAKIAEAYKIGELSLANYTTQSRDLLTEDAQLKQQLAEQEIDNMRRVSQARINELQRIKEERDALTQIDIAKGDTGITRSSMSQWKTNNFLSLDEPLERAKKAAEDSKALLGNTNLELQELEQEKSEMLLVEYTQRKRQLLVEQAQNEKALADAEMARIKAVEEFRLSLLDKNKEIKLDNISIKGSQDKEWLANIQKKGKINSEILEGIRGNLSKKEAENQLRVTTETIDALEEEYQRGGISLEKYTDRMRKLQVEQAQNRATLAESDLSLLEAQENQRIDILMKSLDRQVTIGDAINKLETAKMDVRKAGAESKTQGLEQIKAIGETLSPGMEKSTNPELVTSYLSNQLKLQEQIDQSKINSLKIQTQLNVQNLAIEKNREEVSLRKQEIEARQALLIARNGMLAAQAMGDERAIAIAQQQVGLANDNLSAIVQQLDLSKKLYGEKEKQLGIESASTLKQELMAQRAAKYEQAQKRINSLAQTLNNILDKQKEKIEKAGAYKSQIFDARLAGAQGNAGLLDKAIDFQTQLNNPESDLLPSVREEMEKQRKSALGGVDISSGASLEDLYKKRLSMEDSIAKQKVLALESQQTMDKTIFQMEMDRLKIEMTTASIMASLAANQAKGTPVEQEAQAAKEQAAKGLQDFDKNQQVAKDTLAAKQALERYQLDQEIYNSKNEERMKMAQGGFKVPGEVGKAPTLELPRNLPDPRKVDATYTPPDIEKTLANQVDGNLGNGPAEKSLGNIETMVKSIVDSLLDGGQNAPGTIKDGKVNDSSNKGSGGLELVPNNTDNSVNIQSLTVISSDPTGDARKVIGDLTKAKNRF